jgi:hypothetical protein
MKKTDIAMIILIASFSVMVSYFVVSSIPSLKSSEKPVQVKTIDEYSSEIPDIDKAVFSDNAINPTVQVTIGEQGQVTDGAANN